MKVELNKVNEPNGNFWYGIWIDDSCQTPSFGVDLEKAKEEYNKILEAAKSPKPRYEIIQSETIN